MDFQEPVTEQVLVRDCEESLTKSLLYGLKKYEEHLNQGKPGPPQGYLFNKKNSFGRRPLLLLGFKPYSWSDSVLKDFMDKDYDGNLDSIEEHEKSETLEDLPYEVSDFLIF